MSALTPSIINSMVTPQFGNLAVPATAEKASASSKIVRKHYYDGHSDSNSYQSHSYGSGGGKKPKSIALSALTLLAFLFFLHVLQTCIQEQMDSTTPQVVVMQAQIKAGRDAEAKQKEAQKRVGQENGENVKTTQDQDQDQESDLYNYQSRVPVKLRYN